ncbi:hypothetical protein BLL52_3478 [Rhodoferax antarcticus ANT.BR]|uniref:Uncharacterized protein n=2 Tax=Rhodoferax antarcticus TaxID=81479 RepID=A0A1Q8YBI4_9BURK|nr:hypothetical protein BLL52_3478 [Rhodoferax antarcticus ANT.BR]
MEYLTFPELIQRWQCRDIDICHLIIQEKLIPSFWVRGLCGKTVNFENDEILGLQPIEEYNFGPDYGPNIGPFLFLRYPYQNSLSDCSFSLGCDSPLIEKNVTINTENCWCTFNEPISLQEVLNNGTITLMQIINYEACSLNATSSELSKKERAGLLNIIGCMIELFIEKPNSIRRSAFTSDAQVIATIEDLYKGLPGTGKSNVQTKFAEAKRNMAEYLLTK